MPEDVPVIKRLPDVLANRIAAGEVVERPASVVRELLDNSVDAGAAHIDVEALGGGADLIKVSDDGYGIAREQLALALERHATSKLRNEADLSRIATLGFRGEALPSIASVSRFELVSRPHAADRAFRIYTDADASLRGPEPAARRGGTTVSVRDLFFSVPARRRFLKGERTELRHLREHVLRAALANPALAFKLRHGGRSLLDLPSATGLAERVARACGADFMREAIELSARDDASDAGLALEGWVSLAARAPANVQYLFVNGRAVSDRLLRHAVVQAAEQAGYAATTAAFVLFVHIDASLVDVNVHPAKQEVRFREPRMTHDFVRRTLRESLNPQRTADRVDVAAAASSVVPTGRSRYASAGSRALWDLYAQAGASGQVASSVDAVAEPAPTPRVASGRRFEGRIGKSGIVVTADSLWLVDLGAALRADAQVALRAPAHDAPPGKPLLVPETVTTSTAEADAVQTYAAVIAQLGVELRQVGPDRLSLRRAPPELDCVAPAQLVEAVAAATLQCSQADLTGPDGAAQLAASILAAIDFDAVAGHLTEGRIAQRLARLDGSEAFVRHFDGAALERLAV